jgi:probable F420-dependent oxidoreductase
MRFGLGVPTGTEGMMYPVPYATPDDAVRLAVAAEELGFDSVWGNDHVSTQAYVRAEFPNPPRFYDPYLYLAYVAAQTSTLGLATAVTVMSFRHPVVVAKQAATLDQLSHGRFILGLGIGAYREEAEAMWPDRAMHRGRHADEFFRAIDLLLNERHASFGGEFISFRDVESFPKPAQPVLPVLSGGNAPGSRERAAKYATGWLPAVLSPAEVASGLADIRRTAERSGRELPAGFDVAPQLSVTIGRDKKDALARFERTQLYAHMRSLSGSTLREQQGGWTDRNLIGSTADILEQVHAYAEAGVTTLAGLLFGCVAIEETLDAMADFAENVIAPYRKSERKATPSPRLTAQEPAWPPAG